MALQFHILIILITCLFEKQAKNELSLKTQFKIEFLLPFTSNRKVLGKMSTTATGLKKFGARSCRAPNVHQTLIGGSWNIMHQHYFSW